MTISAETTPLIFQNKVWLIMLVELQYLLYNRFLNPVFLFYINLFRSISVMIFVWTSLMGEYHSTIISPYTASFLCQWNHWKAYDILHQLFIKWKKNSKDMILSNIKHRSWNSKAQWVFGCPKEQRRVNSLLYEGHSKSFKTNSKKNNFEYGNQIR